MKHFNEIQKLKPKKKSFKGAESAAGLDPDLLEDEYFLLYRWVVWITFWNIEPQILYFFDWIPFLSVFLAGVKYKLFSMDSEFYLKIWDKIKQYTEDFDVLEYSWRFFVDFMMSGTEKILFKFKGIYRYMSKEQLEFLSGVYQQCIDDIGAAITDNEETKCLRISRWTNNPLHRTEYSQSTRRGDPEGPELAESIIIDDSREGSPIQQKITLDVPGKTGNSEKKSKTGKTAPRTRPATGGGTLNRTNPNTKNSHVEQTLSAFTPEQSVDSDVEELGGSDAETNDLNMPVYESFSFDRKFFTR